MFPTSVQVANKRARKKKAIGKIKQEDWEIICTKYLHRCLACFAQKPLTIDHVIPLSKGGANLPNNIQPLCTQCNNLKGTRTIDYRRPWFGRNGLNAFQAFIARQ